MSKTPSKKIDIELRGFSPKEIISPSKCTSDISKTIYNHISILREQLTDWKKVKEKGTKICKAISALQQRDPEENYYSTQLDQLTKSLLEALESLGYIVEGIQKIDSQLQALSQLHSGQDPVISMWSSSKISENVTTILELLRNEYSLKEIVTENIAHTKDVDLIELYASSWEFDIFLNDECSAYLFAEVGLPVIT